MAKPHIHAISSAKRYGGVPGDYVDIHEFMDSSKKVIGDNRHRCLTHNTWFISEVLPRVFGQTRVNSDGKTYSVRDVGERHCLEDYAMKFIPTAQDFLCEIEWKPWMDNGNGTPPSCAKLFKKRTYEVVE